MLRSLAYKKKMLYNFAQSVYIHTVAVCITFFDEIPNKLFPAEMMMKFGQKLQGLSLKCKSDALHKFVGH